MPSRSKQRRKGYRHIARREMIAIVFVFVSGRPEGKRFHTQEIPRVLRKFEEDFVKKQFPTAQYINYYKRGQYYYRKYLIEQKPVYCRAAIDKRQRIGIFRDFRDPVLRCMQENSLY